MKEIKLTKGYVAQVDDSDFERVNQFKWYAMTAHKTVYGCRKPRLSGAILLHRFIMKAPNDGTQVDHKDFNGLNCQQDNLRLCNSAENNRSREKNKNNTSGFKGVVLNPKGSNYQAYITFNRKHIYIGGFDTLEDAARAYDAKARELFGEFARLNFP